MGWLKGLLTLLASLWGQAVVYFSQQKKNDALNEKQRKHQQAMDEFDNRPKPPSA
jgi:hypothetical protein